MTIEEEEQYLYLQYFYKRRGKKITHFQAGADLEKEHEMAGGGLEVVTNLANRRYLDMQYVEHEWWCWINEAGKSRYKTLRKRKKQSIMQGPVTFYLVLFAALFPFVVYIKDNWSHKSPVKQNLPARVFKKGVPAVRNRIDSIKSKNSLVE
jgi:hypothetical protein